MYNMKQIQRTSRRLKFLLLAILCILPLANGGVWLFMNSFPEIFYHKILPHFVSVPLPGTARLMGFVVMMIPTGIAMCGSYYLMKLFHLYEQGDIFNIANVRCFRKLSRVLIWWFIVGIVHKSLLSVALTLHNPPGQRMITLELSSSDLTALLTGVVLAVISWVMEEGRKLQEDQDLTV
jgi:Protein of unknown function (DUF2975)